MQVNYILYSELAPHNAIYESLLVTSVCTNIALTIHMYVLLHV